MKKRLTTTLLLAALVGSLLTGCGSKPTGSSDSQSGGGDRPHANEITVGLANDLDESLDPHKTGKAGTREVMFNVFEGLMKPTPQGDLVPALAEKYKVSPDGLTYTFTLREGVQYHNGQTVTAGDVVWSIQRCANPTEAGVFPVEAFQIITHMETPDDRTVVFTLDHPDVEFLSYLTCAVIPADYTQQDTRPVGTGPFAFVSRSAQDTVVLERFDGYWGEKAKLDKVTLKIIENADSMMLSLQSRAIDLCNHLPTAQAIQLKDDFNIVEGAMSLVQALYLNNKVEPLNNELVRQALCYGTDRQAILDLAFDGYGSMVGTSMYPTLGKYFDDSVTNLYPYDVEKAKALLAQAGYPDGFHLTITAPTNYPQHMATAQVLVDQYKAIGVEAEIKPVDWNTWTEDAYHGRNFEATVVGLDASAMTARAMLERFQTDHRKNFINYASPDFDRIMAEAMGCTDDARQVELYKQAQQDLARHAANVYIQAPADLVAVAKGLEGVQFYPIYVLDLSSIHWAE